MVGSNGLPTHVLGVYPQGRREVYRVTTQDGASTLACGEHLWTVRTPDDKRRDRWRTVQTQDMAGNERRGHTRRFELPWSTVSSSSPRTCRWTRTRSGSSWATGASRPRPPVVLHGGSRARSMRCRRHSTTSRSRRRDPEVRDRRRAEAPGRHPWRAPGCEPGDDDRPRAGSRRDDVVDEVRSRGLPSQLLVGASCPSPGAAGRGWRAGRPARPHLSRALLHDIGAAARRRALPGAVPRRSRLLGVSARPKAAGPGGRTAETCLTVTTPT